jgi:signal transduction histidine kinase/CheY-like chemotaxis protein
METVLLNSFAVTVPTCVETEDWLALWQVFQQNACDQVVVVNAQHRPIGVLSLRQLVAYGPDAAIDSPGSSLGALLEPIRLFSEQDSLEQVRPYLSDGAEQHWVLVDAAEGYKGVLDRLRLLQFWVAQMPVASSRTTRKTRSKRQSANPPVPRAKGTDAAHLLDPLLDLLERLPVPLMLQTLSGRVITQNLVWRQQIGQLEDPTLLHQEAARVLEAESVNAYSRAASVPPATDPSVLQQRLVGVELAEVTLTLEQFTNPDSAIVCRSGSFDNTCICTCPMKNGQDRIWQFIKIPVGSLNLHSDELITANSNTLSFRLASLWFTPDPTWRSLQQSEPLWLVLAQDVTEQQQVARELAAKNADLIQLNRLKDEFLACISHELKTPLTAVLGLSSLLKDQSLGTLNERQSRYARLIHQNGRHLILIVNNILDLTRIETGQLELHLEPVEVETVCNAAYAQACQLQSFASNAEQQAERIRSIQFSLEVQPGLTHLRADEVRLRQMLANLLSNAIKFTEPDGAIGIRVELWESWLAFTVWDTGIGIPADKQHLIFQKFQQLENPLTRQFEGTGLGLVLTQRLARLHGGDVTFTSVEGEGSQFTLLLPPSPPSIAPLSNPSQAKPTTAITSRSRLIVVVEFDPKNLDHLMTQLASLGYRVAIARSGTEALEKTRRLQPAVVFLNPLLPTLSGWDVLTLLKSDAEARHIPVVVTSTRVEKNLAFQNGADQFLTLPIGTIALQRCLDELHSSSDEPSSAPIYLTVLHLREGAPNPSLPLLLTNLLHPHHCRVLEVDDLEQADLVTRVWKPDLVLLEGVLAEPLAYLQHLSQYPYLSTLPLVTLSPETTQVANQVPGLAVFPCLTAPITPQTRPDDPEVSALLQVMQMAVGINWTPHILVVDAAILAEVVCEEPQSQREVTPVAALPKFPDSPRALVQYLHTAGFRSAEVQSWQELLQQLQHHSVDLVLICVQASTPNPTLHKRIQVLRQLPGRPPTLVWNRCLHAHKRRDKKAFDDLWGPIATTTLPTSLSMSELLVRIHQALSDRQR